MYRRLALAATAIALVSAASTAVAAPHAMIVLPCERCHTLDDQSGDPTTTYLSSAAPNLSIMIGMTTPTDANGDGNPDAPNILGCYLCHTQADRINPADKMKNVSNDFLSQTSMHAIGRHITPPNADTNNEFQSNWTGNALVGWTGGANVPDEVQCVWCHDMATDTYPDHRTPAVANPKLLYNVTTATDMNSLCFNRCHVGTSFPNGGQSVPVPAMGHVGWAAFNNGGTAAKGDDTMVTGRGSAIRTADCIVCHNTHSSNKEDLIRDGLSEGGTKIEETNCTAICHVVPAQWLTKGHGMDPDIAANVSCGPCHDSAVSHRTGTNALRFSSTEDTADASIAYNGATDQLDNDFDGGIDALDPGNDEGAWVYKRESICAKTCHQTYSAHGGDVGDNGSSGYASCLDCHDPHGPSVPAANIKMIRGAIGATAGGKTQEASAYTGTTDFYNAAGTGVCDNVNCHGATFTAILNDPTSSGYAEHQGRGVNFGFNCTSCHKHAAAAGGFMANCYDCHDYPPATGAHLKHRQLGYSCYDCHYNNNHNPTGVATIPANFYSDYNRFQVEVAFNPAFNSDANNGSLPAPSFVRGAAIANLTCAGLACHNPDNAVTGKVLPADETNNTPVWGLTYDACTDCHGVNFSGDPGSGPDAWRSHNKHDSKYLCTTCHADVDVGASGPGRASHGNKIYETGQVIFGGTLGANTIPPGTSTIPIGAIYNGATPAYNDLTDVCTNVYCHGNFVGGATANAPDWSAKTGGSCGACHGATAAAPPQGNVHPQHTGNNQAVATERQYSFPCNYCHYSTTTTGNTITGAALHVNGYSEFAFDPTLPRLAGAVYGGDATVGNNAADLGDICSTLYCHGAGAPFPTATMGGTDTTPEWNVASTANCGTCHLDTTAAWNPGGSNRHQVHVGSVGTYNMGCDICHYSVTTDGATIAATGPASHVNFQANVAFSAADPRLNTTLAPVSFYGGDTVVGSGYGTCDNTFCHSPGTDLVPPFEQAPVRPPLTWDSASSSCENCHGATLNGGPFYADGALVDGTAKANKHQVHTRDIFQSFAACTACHPTLGTPAFLTIHVNGSYDPAAGSNNALDDFNFTRGVVGGGVNGTCDAVVCHGGNTVSWAENMTAAPWNANGNHFTCDICHSESGGLPTNTDVNDFSIDVVAPGAVMSKVSASEYSGFGHGFNAAPGVFPRNINKQCSACHDSTISHETGAANLSGVSPLSPNPFRLRDQDAIAPGVQSCSANAACHVAGTVGPATGKTLGSIVTHSNEAMAPDSTRTWPAWNPRCTECHDPHGDAANISMIQREIYDKGSTVQALNTGSEDWGVPTLPNDADANALVFTNNSTGIAVGSYAQPAPNFSGVCQECHERASGAPNGVTAFHDGPAGGTEVAGNHPASPGDCSLCHTHDKAFKAQGCYSCHGNAATRAYWPDGAAYPDIAGAHLNHVNTVGTWLYNENGNVAGAGLLQSFTAAHPGLTSDVKQKAVCAFCHPNPGLARAGKPGETNHDDNGAGTSPADVLGDGVVAGQFQLYYNGTLAPLPRGSVTDTDATFTAATHSCSNVNCHNQVATPAGANNWNVPPVWTTTSCATIQCHGTPAASGAHATHFGAAAKNYACTECHVNPTGLQHGNGQVNLLWTAGLENDGDGFYDHDASGAASAGDNNFAPEYSGAVPQFRCWNIYCHGDFTGGIAANQPRWGTVTDGDCGTCHNYTSATLTNGSHPTHFDAVYGPNLGAACGTCHTGSALATASHVDGTKSFETRKIAVANPAPVNLAGTQVCNACHGNSSGAQAAWIATVKTEWASQSVGVYTDVTCESCHGQYDLANSSADNTGVAALNVMGNNATYGSAVTGHTRPAGQYPVSLNNAAAKSCDKCHLYTKSHTWGADSAGYASLRIVNSLNTAPAVDLTAATQVEQVCNACHQVVGTELGDQVSSHGNQNAAFVTSNNHDPNAQDFAYRCDACHDVHGLTLNAAANPNIYMVKPQLEVQNYGAPVGGTSPGTTIAVQFTAKAGANSFDDGSGTGVCTTCHNSALRPGAAGAMANFGGQHAGLDAYSSNEQSSDCSGCHAHTWDATAASQDGFMPQLCNACHTYPGLANLGGVTRLLSGVHDIHAGAPGVAGAVNYAFPCRTCHFDFDHNQTGLQVGQVWSVPNANVNIRFDAALNGGTPSYAGAPAYGISVAPGVGGTGTCAGLYCHGNAAPFPVADQGTLTQPRWNVAADGDCGTCHKQSAASMATADRSHPIHAASTAGNYAYGCQVCHYSVTTDGTTIPAASMALHVNGSANVAFNSLADARLDATSAYSGAADVGAGFGSCSATYCHSRGSDRVAPYNDPDAAPAQVLTWGNSANCGACHGFFPDYPDGVNIDGTPKSNKHAVHYGANAYTDCSVCHNSTISAAGVMTPSNHANRVYTVDVNGSLPITDLQYFTFAAGGGGINGSCSTVNCHGGRSAIPWALDMTQPPYNANGNHFTCDICHATTDGLASTTDVNNFQWGDPDGAGVARPTISKVAQSEFNSVGHGAGPALTCASCHSSGVGHNAVVPGLQPGALAGANPFRLSATGLTCSTAVGCHVAGTIGPATGQDISLFVTHSDEKMLNPGLYTAKRTWPAWNPRCTECHDPHGDGANLSMMQRELYDKGSTVLGVDTTNEDWGVPRTTNDNNALVFTDDTTGQSTTGTSYADTNADFSSICQECHEAANHVSYKDGATGTGAGGTANSTGHPVTAADCGSCHKHDTAFKPSGCNGCHGGAANGNYWPDTPGVAAYPDNAGAHLNHMNAIGTWVYNENGNVAGAGLLQDYTAAHPGLTSDEKQKAICAWCHPNPGDPRSGKAGELGHDDNGAWLSPADVHGDGVAATASYQRYYNGTLAPLPRGSVTDTDATFTAAAHSCSNVNCHNEVATPAGANNWNVPPAWTTISCATVQCHAASTVVGSHTAHTAPAQMNYACAECHTTVPAALGHGNGQVNLGFGGLETSRGLGDGYYDKNGSGTNNAGDNGFVPAYDSGSAAASCMLMYCHGADGAWGGTDTTPVWNDFTTATCWNGSCHPAYGSAFQSNGTARHQVTTGTHAVHSQKYAAGGVPIADVGPQLNPHALCYACHNAMHSGGTCSVCHDDELPGGQNVASKPTLTHVNGSVDFRDADYVNFYNNPALTRAATPACDQCHSTANVGGSVGRDLAKSYWGTASTIPCLNCHNVADPAINKPFGAPFEAEVPAPAKDANWTTRGHGNTTSYPWVPNRSGAGAACADCHDAASAHISGALGQDRLTTAGNTLCNNCHDGAGAGSAVTQVSTHANTSGTMGNPPVSYTAQRAQFELNCVECHDVHGTTNIFMVNTDDPDGPLVAPRSYNGGADTTSYLFQGAAVAFTAKTLGSDYAVTVANANKICQTCHTTTGGAGTPVYQHNNATTGHSTSPCVSCHGHDVDANFAVNSQDGFMPKGCTTCHDAASPYDPGNGDAVAPGIDLAIWTASGHGKAIGPTVDCGDCHDIGLPSSPITHLDGTYNSVWENGVVGTRNTNTAHLNAEYFAPVTSVSPGIWDTQVTFDNNCFNQCHLGKLIVDMRHERDTAPAAPHHWSVQMGTHLSYIDGDRSGTPGNDALNAPYPIDCDLNTGANCADTDYAPCVACHDPHGTGTVDAGHPGSNFMMRRKWITIVPPEPYLCAGCHP